MGVATLVTGLLNWLAMSHKGINGINQLFEW